MCALIFYVLIMLHPSLCYFVPLTVIPYLQYRRHLECYQSHTTSPDYKKNMQGIQNMMGMYCQVYSMSLQFRKKLDGTEPELLGFIWSGILLTSTVLYFTPFWMTALCAGLGAFAAGSGLFDIAAHVGAAVVPPYIKQAQSLATGVNSKWNVVRSRIRQRMIPVLSTDQTKITTTV
jgi:hypothetical protein